MNSRRSIHMDTFRKRKLAQAIPKIQLCADFKRKLRISAVSMAIVCIQDWRWYQQNPLAAQELEDRGEERDRTRGLVL